MTNIEKLRRLITKDIETIPYFIDTKNIRGKHIWESLQLLLRIMSKLTNEKVLTDKKINDYIQMTADTSLVLVEAIDNDLLEIEISQYIMDRLDFYQEMSIELELFEVTQNRSEEHTS